MSSQLPAPESHKSRRKPRLAITVGDAAGVGPELALACAAEDSVRRRCHPILVGPANVLRAVARQRALPLPAQVSLEELAAAEELGHAGLPDSGLVDSGLVDSGSIDLEALVPGQFSAQTGRASFAAVRLAIENTLAGVFDAIVTGPIQKEAWHEARTGYLGHTELLADQTGVSEFCMMLSGPACSTVLATIHLPLADAIDALSKPLIERAIRLGGLAAEKRLDRPPRLTVLGLNPHAGENGLLSRGEEENLIRPAIESVRQWCAADGHDWTIRGPVPPDTAFTPAMRRSTDVHICMYHDQGLIPLKALSFDDAVNVTLGLPITRTSVDHGTAMDLAWKGLASPNSMRAAIAMAIDLC